MPQFNWDADAFKDSITEAWDDLFTLHETNPQGFDIWTWWVDMSPDIANIWTLMIYEKQKRQLLSGIDSEDMRLAIEAAIGTVEAIISENQKNAMVQAIDTRSELAPPEN